MKFTVLLLLLTAVSHATEVRSSRSKQKEVSSNTDKRALEEGNSGVDKRASVIPTALPSVTPGIVYADPNQLQVEKSPAQQIYATPLPGLAKISDVLTGQGPPFQAAITSHLFSPVSIYQTRLPGYEVSAPISSRLAYTENISYQPQQLQQQPQQFTPEIFKTPQKQNFLRVTYPQEQFQQLQPQQFQQINQYQQLQAPQIQPIPQLQHQQPPHFIRIQSFQQLQNPLVYNQQPPQYQGPVQFSPQPAAYVQQQLPANVQPGIVYAREEDNNQKSNERDPKIEQPQRLQQSSPDKPAQNYNDQQGAVSFASFSVGPQVAQIQQSQQYEVQRQAIQYQPQPQPQYQPQTLQIQRQQPQIQPKQQQIQTQHQYQIQRQPLPQIQQLQSIQYQPQLQQQLLQTQPQVFQKQEPSVANSVNTPSKPVPLASPKQQLTYYRPEPVLYQPQIYQSQELVPQQQFSQQVLAVPTFPPVQFFGKFAHELFRNYQQK